MSKFFKALKQAERDRALRRQAESDDREQIAAEPASPPSASRLTPPEVDQHLVSLLQPTSFEAEQYRALRHLIEQMRLTKGISVVGVSSPSVGDGKTITAINLAGSLAQGPKTRVLLVETDLRRPSLARYLGLGHRHGSGLVDAILKPDLPLEVHLMSCPQFNLTVLPAGHPQLTSYELLNSPRFDALLDEIRKQYDYVVLDTPPLIPLSDCRLIMKMVDTLILVVAAHQTPRKLVEEALNLLDPAKVLGIVFNNDDRPLAGYYHKYDKYDDHQQNGRDNEADRMAGGLRQLLRRPFSRTST
ncbi:MAG: hypothetical protein C3F12_00995 [Candidatus Methylomirabilota bacterium]|nr:MAG: hypothetical protein C3F12_00995 [candidate division NC10 bacterium]